MLIARSNIELRLNTEVTPAYAARLQPDAIIAAVGSVPITPSIPGIDSDNVHQAIEVFNNPALAKGKTLILGAGLVGTELAIYLAGLSGCDVELVEMLGDISSGGNSCHKRAIDDMIEQKGIPIHFNTKAVEITAKGARCQGSQWRGFLQRRHRYPRRRNAATSGGGASLQQVRAGIPYDRRMP